MASALKLFRVSIARGTPFLFGVGSQSSNALRTRSIPLIRSYASKAGATKSSSGTAILAGIAAAAAGGGFYYWATSEGTCELRSKCDYQKVYNAIAEILDDADYDDGSYGPVFIRLAWHASGTYDKTTGTGGSNLGTMRFDPEASHGANAGLHIARAKLEKIKQKFPKISYGDLWTLAGIVAVQEMGGPVIPWKPGRVDGAASDCPPEGRLPDGANSNPQHPRDVFYRMGFNDQEIVALMGAHTLGRCHTDRSGFDGPWTNSPTSFTNSYFVELLGRKWVDRSWKGPKQLADKESGQLMMLPADMVFAQDKEFKKWSEIYAKDEKKFFEDFSKAWTKLTELGVNFKEGTPEYRFKTTSA